jgi:peptide/nickel transport system substrate-binding protein
MEIIEATIDGGYPQTIDPAACYDSASGELLMNMYDTLIFFNGEHVDQYIQQLASNWTIENITGLELKNNDLDLYFRYTFKLNSSAHFWDGNPVTPADVEYCVKREMFMDYSGGPQWMFFEPLLNNWGILGLNVTTLDGNPTEQARVGSYIDNAVQSNATHVWFNLAFPGAYAPFMQILSQPWSSVYEKAWATGLGRSINWDGNIAHWFASWNPPLPPFDDPTPVAMGSGPFAFDYWDATLMRWSLLRNHAYFRGWPLDWPAFGGSKPQGYVEHFVVSWAYDWNTRSTKFLSGDVDYCAVPRQYMSVVLGQPGIRCTYPLPSLAVDALFYNYNIDPSTPYGTIYDYGVLGEAGIPRDFFSDVNVRKAFSHLINFTSFYNTAYLGEAMQPPTAIIPGLPYYNATITKYDYNLATATTLLQAAWGGNLWTTGFTIQLIYRSSSMSGPGIIPQMLAANINSLNPKFHATTNSAPWAQYLYARDHAQLTTFTLGWLGDYPDAHNFAYPFYYSHGNFAWRASYSDPTMDALIELGIRTPDGPVRAQIYSDIQQKAIDTCPSIAIAQATGRHFERTWICGWYYNPSYSGNYVANTWKWYYTPHAQLDTVTNSTSNLLPYDVNYDGKIDMKDIGSAAASFGSFYGPPTSPRWVYRCDVNNDRKIDMKDIGMVAQNFGKTSTPWTPPP